MAQQHILLLEDDLQLSDTVKQFLDYSGYKVYPAYDAHQAKDIVYEQHIDLMLLDIKVPHQNGFNFLAELRAEGNMTPAIFITSLNSVDDVTKGFDIGCDDYIRKPFALKELRARIEVLFKRNFGTHQEQVDLGNGYSFDIKGLFLNHNNKKVSLKTKEVKLLALFLKNPNKLLSYDSIFEVLWEYDETPSQGSLRAYINTLRHALGKAKIETVKHSGYRYVTR
ncbi:response regulator transcription factor [bacterium]|nr:response regulator transcription factor [bacterium]MBU1958203.1 response regulator transcription factor [bacterium]